jgi:hypothetical protein
MSSHHVGEDSGLNGHGEELSLFLNLPKNNAIISRDYVVYRPTSQLGHGLPIDINVPGNGQTYKDLYNSRLVVEFAITDKDGKDIVAADIVSVINNPLHSMFKQVDFSLQQINSTSEVNLNYGFKSYVDNLTSTTEDCKSSFLSNQGFKLDTEGTFDNTNAATDRPSNVGLFARNKLTKAGKKCYTVSRLMVDICQQKRLLLNGVEISIKIYPQSDEFVLMYPTATKKYQLKIIDIYLSVCQVNLNPAVLLSQAEILKNDPAVYPLMNSSVKTYTISTGSFQFACENIFQKTIPDIVIVGMVNSDAYNGKCTLNPFNFKHNCMNYIALSIDGHIVGGKAFTPNFEKGDYWELYESLFYTDELQKYGNGISHEMYEDGYTLIAFKTGEKRTNEDGFDSVKKDGLLKLDIKFSKAIEANTILFIYGKSSEKVIIYESRSVTL